MELDLKLMKVLESLRELHQVIKNNIQSENNKDGFFRQGEAEYLTCLELKSVQLESLFYKDQLQWIERAEAEKKKAGAFTDQLKEFVERQGRELAAILRSNYKSKSKSKPKLPLILAQKLPQKDPPINIQLS